MAGAHSSEEPHVHCRSSSAAQVDVELDAVASREILNGAVGDAGCVKEVLSGAVVSDDEAETLGLDDFHSSCHGELRCLAVVVPPPFVKSAGRRRVPRLAAS